MREETYHFSRDLEATHRSCVGLSGDSADVYQNGWICEFIIFYFIKILRAALAAAEVAAAYDKKKGFAIIIGFIFIENLRAFTMFLSRVKSECFVRFVDSM